MTWARARFRGSYLKTSALMRFVPKPIYGRMNKHALVLAVLGLAAGIASLEAVSTEAEPPEPDCLAIAPCSLAQLVALPPDGPDSTTDPNPPLTTEETIGTGSARLVGASALFDGSGGFFAGDEGITIMPG
jgi:hypothetical protein